MHQFRRERRFYAAWANGGFRRNPAALQPSGEGLLSAEKRCRCRKLAACLSARWKVSMIRVGFGKRDKFNWTRLAEIEAT